MVGLDLPPTVVLIMILALYLFLGMFLDGIGMLLLTVPLILLVLVVAQSVLAAGLRSVTDGLPTIVAALVVLVPTGLTYLTITATMGVSEARALVDRLRRVLRFG